MAKSPPIPPEQRGGGQARPDVSGEIMHRHQRRTGLQSSGPGDGDVNLDQQGRTGNLRQNTSRSGNVQDR